MFFYSFWLISYPLDPDPWIRIFLRIRIQEAKILRIQQIRVRIRILSTGCLLEATFVRDNNFQNQNSVIKALKKHRLLSGNVDFSIFSKHFDT